MRACVECEAPDVVTGPDGCDVCRACGLVQPGGSELRPPGRPEPCAAAPPGRAARAPRASPTSKERWTAELRQMAARLHLKSGLADTAVAVYESATRLPGWKNRKHNYQRGVLAACIFHACNIHRAHRTPAELCAELGMDPRNARKMVKVTERAADSVARSARQARPTDIPAEVLPRCANRIEAVPLHLVGRVRKAARGIYDRVRDSIDNHRPDTITAGLLSVVLARSGIEASDEEIAAACIVAPNTVRCVANRISQLIADD